MEVQLVFVEPVGNNEWSTLGCMRESTGGAILTIDNVKVQGKVQEKEEKINQPVKVYKRKDRLGPQLSRAAKVSSFTSLSAGLAHS